MSESIFLLDNEGKLIEMSESGYLTEKQFQELLANYPNLISGSQINPLQPRKWLLVSREFGVPDEQNSANRWSLDHLFIDQDGIPTLVEVKRSTDNRIRREVIGQILDYAANAVSYWSVEEIKHRFEESCRTLNQNIEEVMMNFLGDDIDIESFWENTKTNLKAGKIRMLIIADKIPKELQRIIEFLNEQMTPAEILGVEIKQFVGQNIKTLVPRVMGMTVAAEITKGKPSSRENGTWNEESFKTAIREKHGQKGLDLTLAILKWASNKVSYIWYGEGKSMGSLFPMLKVNNDNARSCFALWTYGSIEIQFQYMKDKLPFSNELKRIELLNRLNAIDGIQIPGDKIDKRPSFKMELLYNPNSLQQFLAAFDWYFEELKPFV